MSAILIGALFRLCIVLPPPQGVPPSPDSFDEMSEVSLIEHIQQSRGQCDIDPSVAGQRAVDTPGRLQLLRYLDALLGRFPDTPYREDALTIKLATLSDMARYDAAYLKPLLDLNAEIEATHPQGNLAAENDYHALQAFVYGARYEGMAEDRRLLGTRERYEGFLADHSESKHRPVIRASLVRLLLAIKQPERAEMELAALQKEFPNDPATRRAAGEIRRASATGKSMEWSYRDSRDRLLNPADFRGRVIVIHFWASWSPESLIDAAMLRKLFHEFRESDVQFLGVNLDTSRERMDAAMKKLSLPWPQFSFEKGISSDAALDLGIVAIPTTMAIDRQGVLRAIDPGQQLPELLRQLVADSPQP